MASSGIILRNPRRDTIRQRLRIQETVELGVWFSLCIGTGLRKGVER
jgi:hypothetical protein